MEAVAQCDVPVAILQNRIKAAKDPKQTAKLQNDLDKLLETRELIQQTVQEIVKLATDSEEQAERILTAKQHLTERENYYAAVEYFRVQCFDWHKQKDWLQNIEGDENKLMSIDRHLIILIGHRDKICIHMKGNEHISDRQHGFVQGRSCLTNLIELFEEVTMVIDEGKPVDIVYMDFSKAFDKVPHSRLVQKVKSHGIRGSVLGLLLFMICINDLEENTAGQI
eukprot:g39192.t1